MPYQSSEMLGGGQNCMMMYIPVYTTDLCRGGDRIDDHPSSICMYQLAELIESISSEQI
jgi:Zn-finger protein